MSFVKFKNIVVGVDFSDDSRRALRQAAVIARKWGHLLHVVHVVDDKFFEREMDEVYLTKEVIASAANEALEAEIAELDCPLPSIHRFVLIGDPVETLVYQVKKLGADMIVMGRQGHHSKTTRDPGSTSRRVASYVGCPAYLVDCHQAVEPEAVVACCDFSESSHWESVVAADWASETGAKLHLLHVIPSMGDVAGPYCGLKSIDEAQYEKCVIQAKKKLRRQLLDVQQHYPELDVVMKLKEGCATARIICDYLDTVSADLVVVGTTNQTGLMTRFLGTTAERVNQACACSVLTLPKLQKEKAA